jgi:hypothetical protein
VPSRATCSDRADLARLLGPGGLADLFSAGATPPQDWAPVFSMDGVQTVAGAGASSVRVDAAVVELGSADVPDMLRLAELTRPNPFWPRTIELGTHVGVWRTACWSP